MKTYLLSAVLFLLFIVPARAQDTLIQNKNLSDTLQQWAVKHPQQVGEPTSILTYDNSFWGLEVSKGKLLLSHKEITNFLQAYPKVLSNYKSGRRTLIAGDALAVVGLFSLGYGIFATVNAYKEQYNFNESDRPAGYIFMGAGALAAAGGVWMFFSGQERMRLAIDAYNDHVLTASYQFGVTPSGVGVVVQF